MIVCVFVSILLYAGRKRECAIEQAKDRQGASHNMVGRFTVVKYILTYLHTTHKQTVHSLSLSFTLLHSLSLCFTLFHSLSLSFTLFDSLSLSFTLFHSLICALLLYYCIQSQPTRQCVLYCYPLSSTLPCAISGLSFTLSYALYCIHSQ